MAEKSIVLLQLPYGSVRIRDDGYVNVLDLERRLPEDLRGEKSWLKFMIQEREVMHTLAYHNGISGINMVQGEDSKDGEHFIWAQFDFALDYAAYIDPNLRADIIITYRRVRMGDATLAAEILDRSSENEQERWLRARHELKSHTPLRNLAIKRHNGSGEAYRYCSDELNKATTGRTGRQIRSIAHVQDTRDALDTSHLALQLLGESEQIKAMDHKEAQGNVDIKLAVNPVHGQITSIAMHFHLHDDNLLQDRSHFLLNRPQPVRAALAAPKLDPSRYACRDYHETTHPYPGMLSQVNIVEE